MLKCDGYKMFKGTATITPKGRASYDVTGTWMYRPDVDHWYVEDGKSWWAQGFDPKMVSNIRES